MIELKYSHVGLRCPVCNQNIINPINRFQLASGTTLHCPHCDSAVATIKKKATAANINLNCFACGKKHEYSVSQKSFFSGKLFSFSCRENAVDVLYIGNYPDVDNALFQLGKEIKSLTDKYYDNIEQTYGTYTKSALHILQEKAHNNRIICLCGSYEIRLKLLKNGVELTCPKCGGLECIPITCEEDIVSLMERRSILLK